MPRWASAVEAIATVGGPSWGGQVVPIYRSRVDRCHRLGGGCDPNIAPSIIVGERFGLIPEVYIADSETDPAVFMNDEHRFKVRQFLAICVGDYRPLHKKYWQGDIDHSLILFIGGRGKSNTRPPNRRK